jgi:hypothetical protein
MTKQLIILFGILAIIAAGIVWKYQHMSSDTGPLVLAPSSGTQGGAYKNDEFGFSLMLPAGVSITELEGSDDGSTTLLAQGTPQFQIYIAPFEDDMVLTAAKLRQEIPDMKVSHDKQLSLSDGKVKALAFDSEDESFGATHEIWFIYGGHIYQLKSKADAGSAMESIVITWKFD